MKSLTNATLLQLTLYSGGFACGMVFLEILGMNLDVSGPAREFRYVGVLVTSLLFTSLTAAAYFAAKKRNDNPELTFTSILGISLAGAFIYTCANFILWLLIHRDTDFINYEIFAYSASFLLIALTQFLFGSIVKRLMNLPSTLGLVLKPKELP